MVVYCFIGIVLLSVLLTLELRLGEKKVYFALACALDVCAIFLSLVVSGVL